MPGSGPWINKIQKTGTFGNQKIPHVVEAEGPEKHSRRKGRRNRYNWVLESLKLAFFRLQGIKSLQLP